MYGFSSCVWIECMIPEVKTEGLSINSSRTLYDKDKGNFITLYGLFVILNPSVFLHPQFMLQEVNKASSALMFAYSNAFTRSSSHFNQLI